MVQYSIARLYSTEAANKIPELMQRAKREFENMAIAAQVRHGGCGLTERGTAYAHLPVACVCLSVWCRGASNWCRS